MRLYTRWDFIGLARPTAHRLSRLPGTLPRRCRRLGAMRPYRKYLSASSDVPLRDQIGCRLQHLAGRADDIGVGAVSLLGLDHRGELVGDAAICGFERATDDGAGGAGEGRTGQRRRAEGSVSVLLQKILAAKT
jgi:hypothetical protein